MKYEDIERYATLFKGYGELRVQENRQTQVTLWNGDVVGNANGSQAGISARAFVDGVWGFVSSPESDEKAIRAAISRAADNARFLAAREGRSLRGGEAGVLPSRAGRGDHDLSTDKPRRSRKELIDFVRAVDAYCVEKHPGLQSRSLHLFCLGMEKTLLTADGARAYSLIPRTTLYVGFTMEAGGESIELYDMFGGRGEFEDHFRDPADLFPRIDSLAENLERKGKGVYAKPGTRDVVLGPDLAGILAHEAIGHTVEADLVLGGSVAADAMDREVASPLVTLVDFAYEALGETCPVPVWTDDEGVQARDAVLIDKGVLRSYMHNKDSARHFGVEPTGNARAFDFSDEPLVRMRNTAILPGSSKLDDMIAGIDSGYYFQRSDSGQADSTGEFMFGVMMGYEISGGKLGNALRNTTISGVAFDMLKTVDAVSDDMDWTCAGFCGKKQMIPVGMGGPAIRCRVNIGGRA
ncbi:MAG: peptidase [Treponema sp. GWB1_62_6]|nr:MAG: peptidase [Treponema sp. GWC1_61_84]OHE67737.1 MAG: peptidase [Treponema sp. GWB1_62_6]OHE75619.1 MAG: peptidase [Treponema sp. RIFOXYC1_FULL_61_9]HCM27547.1 peptidase [Treponema sp.]